MGRIEDLRNQGLWQHMEDRRKVVEQGLADLEIMHADAIDRAARVKHCAHPQDEARFPHVCPYQDFVNGIDEPDYCDCCEDCTHECAEDIWR
jgi:hypothetical protein